MGWVKVDDGFFRHRKAIGAGKDGRLLFLAGLCYCGAGLTDGFIPSGALVVLAAETGITKVRPAAEALVAVGLWHETDGGYRIHDFFEWQRSREEIADIGSKRAEAGRKGGKQRASNLLASASSKSKPEAEADTEADTEHPLPGVNAGAPATPAPVRPIESGSRGRRLSPDWEPKPAHTDYAVAKGIPASAVRGEALKFANYWAAESGQRASKVDWDAAFRTWLDRAAPDHVPRGGLRALPGRDDFPTGTDRVPF